MTDANRPIIDPSTGEIIDGWVAHPAADLFPMGRPERLNALTEDIAEAGVAEPVWIDSVGRVLDGRNRVVACFRLGLVPPTRLYEGDDPVMFSVSQNIHRRQLTTGQAAIIALRLVEDFAAENPRGRPQKNGATLHHFPESKRAPRSTDRAAAIVGVSGRTVATAKALREKAADLLEQVWQGELELGRAGRILRDREAEQRRIEEARQDIPASTVIDIREGDFRTCLADLTDIDAIITDPPYPKEFLPLLADLATLADKILTPDGIMAVLIGQTHLPEVYKLLEGGRPYRWTACFLTPGARYASHARKLQSNWKPLLVYGGGPRFSDVISSEGTDADAKNHHRWGQDFTGFQTVISRLTRPGQTVVDPFMGSGTTLLAAQSLGRHAIGCDIDPAAVATAKARCDG